ncbi:DUF1835 domain-containing protein [Clostridium gasigenes]|uniref:DUF1835 domain-containing protein n=1 Tax=Clostridium gasigenes TaxID=94869 RepID=UPI001C0C0040|nr:DUF1835 domain-containing protein [Clostridium gasigenes]MBU3108467.1 DUF1835 domain-containing protein [Clostridium gasigenes]
MINNTIHICFSYSTMGSLKTAISKKIIKEGTIIALLDDLSKGPIENISDINNRIAWYDHSQLLLYKNYKYEMIKSYETLHSTIDNLTNENIYIWYGDNCLEICGLLYTLSLFKGNLSKIHFVRALPIFSKDSEIAFICKGTNELIPENLPDIFNKSFHLTSEEILSLIKLWDSLTKENANVRIADFPNIIHSPDKNASKENRWPTIKKEYFIPPLDGLNKIKSVDEDYYDNLIFEKVILNYPNVISIVGGVICEHLDSISDSFIFYRIVQLIKEGKLSYTGDIASIRSLKVHLAN